MRRSRTKEKILENCTFCVCQSCRYHEYKFYFFCLMLVKFTSAVCRSTRKRLAEMAFQPLHVFMCIYFTFCCLLSSPSDSILKMFLAVFQIICVLSCYRGFQSSESHKLFASLIVCDKVKIILKKYQKEIVSTPTQIASKHVTCCDFSPLQTRSCNIFYTFSVVNL